MIKMQVFFESEFEKMQQARQRAKDRFLYKAGGKIRGVARDLTRQKKPAPSEPGKPYRRGSGMLRDSIVFNIDKAQSNVAVGYFRYTKASDLHELGGIRRINKQVVRYPRRPVLEPALEKSIAYLKNKWPEEYREVFEK